MFLQNKNFNITELQNGLDLIRRITTLPEDYHRNSWNEIWSFFNDEVEVNNFINDLRNNSKHIINGLKKYQSIQDFEGIITVGSVDFNNQHTNFSSYGYINNDNLPFVSSYGEGIYREKDKSIFESYKKIKDYLLTNPNIDPQHKSELQYLIDFNGTSKAAPLITGLISLLQNQIKRNLTISETKLLLAASSNYAATKTDILKNSDSDLPSNTKNEYCKDNRTKNKTGFGIPKLFKMKKIIKSE